MIPHIERSIYNYENELKEVINDLASYNEFSDEYGYSYYRHNSKNATCMLVRKRNQEIINKLRRRDSLVLTIKRLKSYVLIKRKIVVEADCEISDMMDNKDTVTHENFEDTAGSSVDSVYYGRPETLQTGQTNRLVMSEFLSRPLKLSQAVIPLGVDFTFELDVWNEFVSHPSVRAKIRNYAYFNGTLNLRITVSGTPWHFGKLQVSYQPLAGRNKNLEFLIPQLADPAARHLALTYLSQAKGCRVIDVHDNKPLEIQCPFISPQPMLRLFNKSPLIIAASDDFDDFVGFGKIYINSISPPAAINVAATEIGLQVYAWVTDLELGMPSGTVIEIGTEASFEPKGVDERITGPIEAVSSKAATIATYLSNVPIIGRFAHASIKPLTMISKVASLFGFSYPTIITQPSRFKNEPFQNACQFIGSDTGQRLTLDPKQELSIDPRATGVDTDDMAYDAICSVETLLDVFEWSTEDGQLAGSIWMVPINPTIGKRIETVVPGTYLLAPTALSFVAAPHIWWRGDITFRFEIVCSKFHRGTLAVVYEPNISQNVVIDTALDLNKQYIKKIDLQSVTDFEVTVKWAYPRPWARILTNDLMGDLGTVGFLGDALFDYANGYIAVVPYTELQSPDGSSITVNVYIKSDNMTFNQFTLTQIPTVRPSVEGSYEPMTPNPVESSVLNDSSASDVNISTLTFGETPISFRSALKRFSGWRNNANTKITTGTHGPILRYRNFASTWPTPSYSSHTQSWPNLMGYLRYAYLGMRGGTKHRLILSGPNNLRSTASVMVRLDNPGAFYDNELIDETSFQSLSASSIGSTLFMPMTNAGVEFEVPMYTPDLFWVSFTEDFMEASSLSQDDVTVGYIAYFSVGTVAPTAADPIAISSSSAAAEDFSFMRFSGAPVYQFSG